MDAYLKNGQVVNVYTGEVLKWDVGIAGDRIVYVGPAMEISSPRTQIIDAAGDYLLPGFFDAHAHADLFYNPFTYADFVATRGTTGFFNDGHDLANALGARPYLEMMSGLAAGKLSIYTGVPVTSPPFPGIEGDELWTAKDIELALEYDNVLSVSEVTPYLRLLQGDDTLHQRLLLAKLQGRLIEGHTTGANLEKLNKLATAGVTSCHESLNSEDVINRMRLGFYVMLRHGSIRRDLPRFMEAIRMLQSYDTSRVMLVSDGIFPDHLLAWGNLDWLVKEAIHHGIEPIRAIQMVTINPARYFRMDHLLGGIAPGRLAHVLMVSSLQHPTPRLVMAKGKIVAREGRLVEAISTAPGWETSGRRFKLDPLTNDVFKISSHDGLSCIPVIKITDQTVTEREDLKIPAAGGFYQPAGDILQVALFERSGRRMGKGFVRGFCPNLGGIATTIAHETHGLLVLGQNTDDMALAANDVLHMGGGIALVQSGEFKARVPLAVGGITSHKGVPDLARDIRQLHQVLRRLGCVLQYPLWTLGFLSFTSVLRLRITVSGVFDVKHGKIVYNPR
jgi:adenine deaminase